MSVLRFIKYIVLALFLIFLVPIGVGELNDGIIERRLYFEELSRENQTSEDVVTQTVTGKKSKLNNPNPFNREFEICSGSESSRFYSVEEHSSYIREIYDKFGIQIYLLTYTIDWSDGINETQQETKDEVNAWIESNGKDPYGIYYVLSCYDYEFSDERFREGGIYEYYYKTAIDGYRVYGSKVDEWWDGQFQKSFEDSIKKGEFYISDGSNCYKDFVQALSMTNLNRSVIDKIGDITDTEDSYDEVPTLSGAIFVFTLFSVLPIGIVIIIIVKDIKKDRYIKMLQREEEERRQYEETQRILNTPIRTLEEEMAEDIKDKYDGPDITNGYVNRRGQ